MSRVFVVQAQQRWDAELGRYSPKFDLEPAREHGELVHLLSPTAKPFNTAPIIEELQEKLHDFCDEDFLLLVGNPCLIGLTVAIASEANGGRVRMLQWNGRDQYYHVIDADMVTG